MEETNYKRATIGIVETTSGTQTPTSPTVGTDEKEVKQGKGSGISHEPEVDNVESGTMEYRTNKSYFQRLSLWQTMPGENMITRAFRSLRYLGWPVIFYAGFSYGSYLVSPRSLQFTFPLHILTFVFDRFGSMSSTPRPASFSDRRRTTSLHRWSVSLTSAPALG